MASKWVTAATQKENFAGGKGGSFRNMGRNMPSQPMNDNDADDKRMPMPKKKKRHGFMPDSGEQAGY